MWKVLFRARDRFASDQRGNVGIIFGVAVVPLIGLLGGAVDVTRHNRYETTLLNAMDSAAIALVRKGADNDEQADNFVNTYIAGLLPWTGTDNMLHLPRFNAIEIEGGYRVEVAGSMDTAFLPVIGMRTMPLNLSTEVAMSGGKYEVALALDNTGSMAQRNKMPDLKIAAHGLIDDLYEKPGADELVRMALVPFVTSVNIKGEAFKSEWIDTSGTGKYADDLFSDPQFDRVAAAANLGPEFAWKGCVEAREEPYNLDDAAPDDDNIATKWVPYFWPDEPDSDDEDDSVDYANNYLVDSGSGDAWDRLKDTGKYDVPIWQVGGRRSAGPNRACAGEVVELTNDTTRMEDAIDAMAPTTGGSGTNIAEGLAWGWRVLSPGEPFTQGVPYEDKTTTKALVLLSDGYNQLVEAPGVVNSHYTGYGYLAQNRLGTTSNGRVAERNVNGKVTELCAKVKAENIRLYMILFQENNRDIQRVFEDCASVNEETGQSYYYYAPTGEALTAAFADIGEDLTSLRVTR